MADKTYILDQMNSGVTSDLEILCVGVDVHVCTHVCERETGRETQTQRQRQKEGEGGADH